MNVAGAEAPTDLASQTLLAAGYAMAVASALKFVPMWRQRRLRRFLVFEAGTALVVAGWSIRHRPLEASLNAAALVALGIGWYATRRRRA